MKKQLIILATLLSTAAFAGSATAVVKCQSASGRTQVTIGDDDFTSSLVFAKVTVDGQSLNFRIENSESDMQGVYDFKNKVFTQVVENQQTHQRIELYAIPASMKIKKSSSSTTGTFDGMLTANDPRSSEPYTYISGIAVKCVVDYSI